MSEEDTVQDSNDQSQQSQNAQGPVDNEKIFVIVGYLTGGFLFFLPLVTSDKPSYYAKVHANNQILILLFSVIGYIVASFLLIILIGFLLIPLVGIISSIFFIIGIIYAIQEKADPLPVIGKWKLIK